MNIAAFTGGRMIPSTRFRVRQYVPFLKAFNCEVAVFDAWLGAYPPVNQWQRPWWAIGTLASRMPQIIASYHYDIAWIQREMFSTYATIERFVHRPRILDVDDAIWAHRRGGFASQLANQCDSIICGNKFLAEYFGQWNAHVTIVPTGVDTERFCPLPIEQERKDIVIGWSGTSSNFMYLRGIEDVLALILHRHPYVRLRIVSDRPPKLQSLPQDRVEFVRWSTQNEVETIQTMDIGIMPLEDSVEARGKCSYKMLLYMACGLPVVVSSIGMNTEVLSLGPCGFGVEAQQAWLEALETLIAEPRLRKAMGTIGRSIVRIHYGLAVTTAALVAHFKSYA